MISYVFFTFMANEWLFALAYVALVERLAATIGAARFKTGMAKYRLFAVFTR